MAVVVSRGRASREQLQTHSLLYALSIPVLHLVLVCVPLIHPEATGPADILLPAFRAALLLAIPFYLAGIVIGIALTRMPGRIGVTYSVDLAGAALGCVLAVLLLQWSDISTATFAAATLAVAGALCLQRLGGSRAGRDGAGPAGAVPGRDDRERGRRPAPRHPPDVREGAGGRSRPLDLRGLEQPLPDPPDRGERRAGLLLGPGPRRRGLPGRDPRLIIDGSAFTDVTEWHGDPATLDWVQYDVTSVPYHLHRGGDAAIIGTGGGRDVLTALSARSRSVTGIELNGILVDLHRDRLRTFSGLADRPEVKLVHDEARFT